MRSNPDLRLDCVFQALSHPIRRSLVERLARGPETIVRLAEPYDVSLNAISKHVKALEAAGLVVRERDRTYHRLSLEPAGMRPALEWLHHYADFWSRNLQSLRDTLEAE